jgi:primosomal protein N'
MPRKENSPARVARVEPLTRTRAFRGPFDYRLAEGQEEVDVGSVLRLPFGGRVMTGVVVGLAQKSELDGDRLAEPQAILPDTLPPDLVGVVMWVGQE